MKLILKQYLASLKERKELDAVLPDLLSSMGLNVFISPTRGVKEYGVDVAAVGQINEQEEKVYLFSIKSGNLNRETWNGNADQALRPSLDEIQDSFIHSRLPPEHRGKKIVICLCFGGDVSSGIRQEVSGYEQRNTRDNIAFEEWNGDKLSELIQQYLLKEELLPSSSQALLRKSLALLEEPESSSMHFSILIDEVLSNVTDADSVASSITRLNVCLWVLFSWCRDAENLEAAYLSSERALLLAWDKVKDYYSGKNKPSKSFDSLFDTYQQITDHYVDRSLIPYVGLKYALSHAVHSPCSINVNSKLFDVLGRLSVKGHWLLHLLSKNYSENPPIDAESEEQEQLRLRLRKVTESINLLIVNNPILLSPYQDSQAIDVALAITLLSSNSELDEFVKSWLSEMINMCIFAFKSNGMYPIVYNSYEQLLEHRNKDKADGIYKNKVTEASILYPLLAVFCALYKLDSESQLLEQFAKENLTHSTLQYWYPNQYSELSMYSDADTHGSATTDFPMNGKSALEYVKRECGSTDPFRGMSAVIKGKAPLILTACRRYRYPVPFHYLEDLMTASDSSQSTQ
ncbi:MULTISPECIES: hypothetical protein [unclassified Arsukibacterium]|uniref:hypothetical protein n=1 Tax=unclassified Arsukibacterium TaxID=2635278 RepID=UPI000C569E49|nr:MULTISPECIES: hypothetical protein [unclassified Arsukibacterium]MAA93790.1 hypothetical protein [Rheinheimera sp.]MBM33042.1 hypothetical protein [Rheinheimera sp.]HAW92984.1 hypothetical protein [Candidatus Azambacteria bacterium]|tara:strand:- start:84135 stop:85856 length:1722 start_codon:yes stop_codon:yes gene_type:complete